MKAEFLQFVRSLFRKGGNDVFQNTQRRLTLLYSGLIMLFLTLFITIVYGLLYTIILQDQERDIRSMAREEAKIVEHYLVQNNRRNLWGIENQEIVLAGVDQFFSYMVGPNGDLIMGSEAVPARKSLFNLVHGWVPERGEVRKESLTISYSHWNPKRKGQQAPVERQEIRLMMAGEPIYYGHDFVGMLYIGKDVTFAYKLFNWLLVILIGLGILFLGVAFYLSYVMSKKAMVPISTAFTRQREFVTDASHELRTPLSVMHSSIDAMDMTIEEEDPFVRKLLSNMKEEVKRMTKLVGDLLTLARSDSGEVELSREPFDLQQVAENTVESVSPLAASKEIKLKFEGEDQAPVVGDKERIRQLLYILLDNAIKYTPNGGEIKLLLARVENAVEISVQDTGIGIKEEERERIFDRFFRTDKARSRQAGGHGLGLSIAKWIVEAHGGTIHVESELGKGSAFIVKIPVRRA